MFHSGLGFPSAFGDGVASGGRCKSDIECEGNLDCTRVGFFERRCFPVSCARGAAQAILDVGFKSDEYIKEVRAKASLTRNRDFATLGDSENTRLTQALASTPPPMSVFNKNLTACLSPKSDSDGDTRERKLQSGPEDTRYGLQWSAAAAFSYFGKSTWQEVEGFNTQFLSNCVGFLLGADAGLDVLFQIFNEGANRIVSDQQGITITVDPGNTQYVPVFIAGPIGVQVGWFQDEGPDELTITEVTLEPSFGLALGGFSQCYNELTAST